jgi:hypothetical protein
MVDDTIMIETSQRLHGSEIDARQKKPSRLLIRCSFRWRRSTFCRVSHRMPGRLDVLAKPCQSVASAQSKSDS